MKKFLFAAVVLAGVGAGVYYGFFKKDEEKVSFRTASVETKDIVKTIDATGTVEPEDLVDVAARVSGEIIAFGKDKDGREVDYGSEIREGDIIALIDDEIPQSDLREAKAKLEQAKATFESVAQGYTPETEDDDVLPGVRMRLEKLQELMQTGSIE